MGGSAAGPVGAACAVGLALTAAGITWGICEIVQAVRKNKERKAEEE